MFLLLLQLLVFLATPKCQCFPHILDEYPPSPPPRPPTVYQAQSPQPSPPLKQQPSPSSNWWEEHHDLLPDDWIDHDFQPVDWIGDDFLPEHWIIDDNFLPAAEWVGINVLNLEDNYEQQRKPRWTPDFFVDWVTTFFQDSVLTAGQQFYDDGERNEKNYPTAPQQKLKSSPDLLSDFDSLFYNLLDVEVQNNDPTATQQKPVSKSSPDLPSDDVIDNLFYNQLDVVVEGQNRRLQGADQNQEIKVNTQQPSPGSSPDSEWFDYNNLPLEDQSNQPLSYPPNTNGQVLDQEDLSNDFEADVGFSEYEQENEYEEDDHSTPDLHNKVVLDEVTEGKHYTTEAPVAKPDPCSDPHNPCGANSLCQPTPAGPVCSCVPGFSMAESSSACHDVDECIMTPSMCGDSKECTNTLGGYKCSCTMGYREVAATKECVDVNECLEDDTLCGGRDCLNTEGGYTCKCAAGFLLHKEVDECEDVDECLEKDDACGDNAVCKNTAGSFTCLCKSGYAMASSSTESGTACGDVDECLADIGLCGENGLCYNTEGSYQCLCEEGFARDELTKICEDVNECLDDAKDVCEDNSNCVNTVGSYTCKCRQGYEEHPVLGCQDVDECSLVIPVCGDLAVCTNTLGSFNCACREGFEGKPPAVPCQREDIDEEGSQPTPVRTKCIQGYEDHPVLGCQDVDECSLISPVCGYAALCTNTPGSFNCACRDGFEGKPPAVPCQQQDEDEEGSQPTLVRTKCRRNFDCRSDSSCHFGQCRCKAGYTEEDLLCVDKNECELVPGICQQNSVCRNIEGGYFCTCQEEFARYPPSFVCSAVNKCKRECGDNAECMKGEEEEHVCVCDEGYVELFGGGCVEE